jgi:hypothetical protein
LYLLGELLHGLRIEVVSAFLRELSEVLYVRIDGPHEVFVALEVGFAFLVVACANRAKE